MGFTILIVVLSVTVYEPTAEKAEDGIVFLAITLAALMAGLMMNAIVSKIWFKQLAESSREKGQLDLAKYQMLLFMRIAAAEAPALLGIIFFFIFAKAPIEDPLSLLYFAPTAIFYLIIYSHYPTQGKLTATEQRVLKQASIDENPYQQNDN